MPVVCAGLHRLELRGGMVCPAEKPSLVGVNLIVHIGSVHEVWVMRDEADSRVLLGNSGFIEQEYTILEGEDILGIEGYGAFLNGLHEVHDSLASSRTCTWPDSFGHIAYDCLLGDSDPCSAGELVELAVGGIEDIVIALDPLNDNEVGSFLHGFLERVIELLGLEHGFDSWHPWYVFAVLVSNRVNPLSGEHLLDLLEVILTCEGSALVDEVMDSINRFEGLGQVHEAGGSLLYEFGDRCSGQVIVVDVLNLGVLSVAFRNLCDSELDVFVDAEFTIAGSETFSCLVIVECENDLWIHSHDVDDEGDIVATEGSSAGTEDLPTVLLEDGGVEEAFADYEGIVSEVFFSDGAFEVSDEGFS